MPTESEPSPAGTPDTTAQDSRSEYAARMHRVLEHIDRNVSEPLDLDGIAAVANFSAFHFHRLFSAWMGETIGEYVRRRRLEMAALRLATQPDMSVLRVALSVGFGSAEAFARAFKARFGATPTAWRAQDRKNRQTNSKADQDADAARGNTEASHTRAPEASMKVTLIERQDTPVVYMRHVGPYGPPLSDFWQAVVYPWMATNNLLGRPRYGVIHDDPEITAAEKCRYDACIEPPPGFAGTGKYLHTVIPGGKYASTRFSGTASQIVDVWAALLRDWLPASGMQLDARPFLEYYFPGSSYDPKTEVFDCDLCIPVLPL